MEISGLPRKLRNFSNPYCIYSFSSQSPYPSCSTFSHPRTLATPTDPSSIILFNFSPFYSISASDSAESPINAAGCSLICNAISHSAPSLCLFGRCNGGRLDLNLGLLQRRSYTTCRSFLSSSFNQPTSTEKPQCGTGNLDVSKPNARQNQFWDIIKIIRRNEEDLESKLNSLNLSLTNVLVAQIFRVLNNDKVSAFRFFNWIRVQSCKFPGNSDVYSLLIDNFGRLDDYEGMLPVLTEFRRKGIDLNHKAFVFLHVQLSNEASIKISVERVIKLLNEVGGSCRISGVMSLIEMFCSFGSYGMAKFVIEITERRASFYNIIVREQCRRNDFEGARCTLNEMRQVGCSPDVGILNYLLSCLCKNDRFDEAQSMFEAMLQQDCPPNSLTFEVIICHLCEIGKIESALSFLDMMVSRGLEPRLSTHAAFVKSYFNSQRYEEAYRYAVDSSSKHATAQNATYSLLATLHEKRGNLVDAQKILSELIDAGLRPNFPVYTRVFKKLQLQGKEDLANDLKGKFSIVSFQCGIQTG
ncbi:pentatricopeptide repeat-containing protein At1g62930, chloroplastic-like [Momordica charantia]|uniref:Pentatricopeptide repeat-containing protein At1g62930, chloroplastic-like n=1 Tax=Momordica charantia TaxID=3673 RepID=A0A6J1CJ38_MOMCH|nr:pentatricopeptide repeat-containing protein At1g62930, chloroplastic-like [Momordica charantia]